MTQLVLVVDDEPDICELLELTLERMGINSHAAGTLAEAKKLLTQYTFHLCLSDMRLPDGDGIELVRHLQANYPLTPVAVITAHGNMDLAIKTLKAGAFDFVSKPVDLHHLRNIVRSALKLSEGAHEKEAHDSLESLMKDKMMGDSKAMQQARNMILKLARNQAPVFISGESGTGKELAARLIHESGSRADGPFIPVNCGAIPEQLMESEFFGHKKGSFTGAVADKDGLFRAANGGTLFLDEIADLPLPMQVKLLRVIQEKSVRAVGAEKEISVDVRILSASHKDLQEMVEDQHFRQDLYYRLNVIELKLPSLRERPEDIEALANKVLSQLAKRQGLSQPKLHSDAVKMLNHYSFPGNVRELENILERALAMSEAQTISVDDLGVLAVRADNKVNEVGQHTPPDIDHASVFSESLPNQTSSSLEDYLEQTERKLIVQVLEETRYNKTATAKRLGISFNALRYRLKKLNLE